MIKTLSLALATYITAAESARNKLSPKMSSDNSLASTIEKIDQSCNPIQYLSCDQLAKLRLDQYNIASHGDKTLGKMICVSGASILDEHPMCQLGLGEPICNHAVTTYMDIVADHLLRKQASKEASQARKALFAARKQEQKSRCLPKNIHNYCGNHKQGNRGGRH